MSETGANAQPIPWRLLLQIVAAIVGASGLFAAVGTLAGWQYYRSYYDVFGIPFSVLSFSAQEYMFAAIPVITFTVAGIGGLAIGVRLPRVVGPLITKWVDRVEASMVVGYVGASILGVVALVLQWAPSNWEAPYLPVSFIIITVWGVVNFLLGLVIGTFWFLDRPGVWLFLAIALTVFVLGGILSPGRLGEATARHDLDNLGNFPLATFFTTVRTGVPGEKPVLPAGESDDEELYRAGPLRVVVCNNGQYFTFPEPRESSDAVEIYTIDVDTVARTIYHRD